MDKRSDIKQIKVCFILHAVALLQVLLLLRAGLGAALPWACGTSLAVINALASTSRGP